MKKIDKVMVDDEDVEHNIAIADKNNVDQIGEAMGLPMTDGEELDELEVLEERDHKRFELDPESAEDYLEHLA